MKKVRVKAAELEGAALQWVVEKIEGRKKVDVDALIKREEICFATIRKGRRILGWQAAYKWGGEFSYPSPTPEIAAQRCFVAHQLGEDIDVPENLLSA